MIILVKKSQRGFLFAHKELNLLLQLVKHYVIKLANKANWLTAILFSYCPSFCEFSDDSWTDIGASGLKKTSDVFSRVHDALLWWNMISSECDLSECDLSECDLSECDLSRVSVVNIPLIFTSLLNVCEAKQVVMTTEWAAVTRLKLPISLKSPHSFCYLFISDGLIRQRDSHYRR